MSLRSEQYSALKRTRDLLARLMTKDRPKTAKDCMESASACIKHYPPLDKDGAPIFSRDTFGPGCLKVKFYGWHKDIPKREEALQELVVADMQAVRQMAEDWKELTIISITDV